MFKTFGDAIFAVINPLTSTTTLNVVYNYDKLEFHSLPACTISPQDIPQEIPFSQDKNQVTLNFRVRVVDRNKDKGSMEDRLRTLCDSMLTAIRQNETFNNTVCKTDIAVVWGWVDDEEPMRSFDIIITGTEFKSI